MSGFRPVGKLLQGRLTFKRGQRQRCCTLPAEHTQQLATLNKHRGKGQQKVTVEHVNFQAGGQAIVGNVDAGAVRPRKPNQITREDLQTLDAEATPDPVRKRGD